MATTRPIWSGDVDGGVRNQGELHLVPVGALGELFLDQLRKVDVFSFGGHGRCDPGQQEQVGGDGLQPVDVAQRPAEQLVQVGLVGMQSGLFQLRAQCGDGCAQFV
jgi:hypothetical protein